MWNIARTANRARQALRPEDPVDLNFVVDPNFIPAGFLKSDITHHGRRHLLFATDRALTTLSKAKTWYMDGTFDVVGQPFKLLYSFHAFVRSGDSCVYVYIYKYISWLICGIINYLLATLLINMQLMKRANTV